MVHEKAKLKEKTHVVKKDEDEEEEDEEEEIISSFNIRGELQQNS